MPRRSSVKKVKNKTGPIPRPTTQVVLLQQGHSFELVRTAIAATLFEVIFLRKVFPSTDRWLNRFYDPENPDVTYESFIAGSQEPRQGKGRSWHVPIRGQRMVLDELMDRLEYGIKDALSRRYLRKIVLTFQAAGEPVSDQFFCFESYDLTVSYGPDGEADISTEIRDSEAPEDKGMNVHEGKARLQTMLKGVTNHFMMPAVMKELRMQPLPENIRVVIEMEYTDDTPRDYQPQGFPRLTEVVCDDGTEGSESGKVEFNTGFHGLAFNCSLPKNEDSVKNRLQTEAVLQNYNATSPRSEELPSAVVSRPLRRSVGLRRHRSQFSVSDGDNTQQIVIEEAQGVFRRISRRDGSSMLDTQYYQTSPAPSEHMDSYHMYNPPVGSPPIAFLDYTQENREDAERELKDRVPRVDASLHSLQIHDINCECGSTKHDVHMTECLKCHKFHHTECYGYLSNPPETESCYTCLFQGDDTKFPNLKKDCQLRRTIRLFQEIPIWKTLKEAATHLGLDTRIDINKVQIGNLLEELVRDGYIRDQRGGNSQELTEHSTFILVTGMERLISHKLFNPRSGLDELVAETDTSRVEGDELSDRRSSFGAPRTPRASSKILLRTMQSSSQKFHYVDTGSTRTSVTPSTNLSSRGTRGGSIGDVEFAEIDHNDLGQRSMYLAASGSGLLDESSGHKRSAQGSCQGRESWKRMK